MRQPLVSVVCLCFNHERFVSEAIHSVLGQTYPNVELIVVDDRSRDGSVSIIKQMVAEHPSIKLLLLEENLGICAAFNRGLALAKGDFITDFAADDVMLPSRMERLVNCFSRLDQSYGVVFSDAAYINAAGGILRYHTEHLIKKKLLSRVPEGWVFRDILSRYFVCAPTMLVRKEVFEKLKGHDENLAYEDFDFWVRSSREFKYAYLDEVLTKVRTLSGSMSSNQYEQDDDQLYSTYQICRKAVNLCQDGEDQKVLLQRVRYEFRQAIFSNKRREAKLFGELEAEIGRHGWPYYFFTFLTWLPLPWPWLRRKYHQLFYG